MTAEATKPQAWPKYHVLREKDDAGTKTYEPFSANVTARSATNAIKQVTKEAGVFVAIPVKSFRPVKVTVHTETTVRLG